MRCFSHKDLFLDLFDLVVVKEALVSSYLPGLSEGKGQHWNLQFIWHFQDWE